MKITVHPLYLLLGIFLTAVGSGYTFVMYSMALVLHEMAHAAVAARLGYSLSQIVLMPYGAVLRGTSGDFIRPKADILIAAAGPAANLACAVAFAGLWWFFPSTYYFTQAFVSASLASALLNLLPVFPLDGGRILWALLSSRMPARKAYRLNRAITIALALTLAAACAVGVALSYNITYALIGGFIFATSVLPVSGGAYKAISAPTQTALSRGIEQKRFIIGSNARLIDCMRLLSSDYCLTIIITDPQGNPIKTIHEPELRQMIAQGSPATTRLIDRP